MLKVSQKSEYALRAMIELALRRGREGDALVSARAIAESQHIPLRFLEQQPGALHKAGLVESFRGAGGGCRLSRDPSTVRMADIIDAVEGPLYPMTCLDEHDHSCWQTGQCGLQELWGEVLFAIRGVLETTTLAVLAERHQHAAEHRVVWTPDELIKPRG
ncbi:MAG TPA: Rrf2 family transcriptional regulator [Actinomycetota bacterium]|nr:Rrf2 family transcriptional regulator [Actinomycetota bacterium]